MTEPVAADPVETIRQTLQSFMGDGGRFAWLPEARKIASGIEAAGFRIVGPNSLNNDIEAAMDDAASTVERFNAILRAAPLYGGRATLAPPAPCQHIGTWITDGKGTVICAKCKMNAEDLPGGRAGTGDAGQ